MKKELISYDACDGKIVGKVRISSTEEIKRIVECARKAQVQWGRLNIDQRISYIENVAGKLAA
jgi:acyl-CoA reductase-like NAD-dependent aldehyde dehydrogenase